MQSGAIDKIREAEQEAGVLVNRAAQDETRASLISIAAGDHDSPASDQDGLLEQKLAFFRKNLA